MPIAAFRPKSWLDDVPEIEFSDPPAVAADERTWVNPPAADMSGLAPVWFLSGPGSSGKTLLARLLIILAAERGREASLAALDPGSRSLATWFDTVGQPPSKEPTQIARWLQDFIEHLKGPPPGRALLDFGGGDVALAKALAAAPTLYDDMERAGLGPVACYMLTPRVDDLDVLRLVGTRPRRKLLLLNQGRADPTVPAAEAFAGVTRHSLFRNAIARGALALWLPALDSEVMQEIELKRLHFTMARDGGVPEGRAIQPISGLKRCMVQHWMERVELALEPVAGWLL